MDTTTTTTPPITTTGAEWSVNGTIAAELRDRGGTLTYEGGRFELRRDGQVIACGARLAEVALMLRLVRNRPPKAPWILVRLPGQVLRDMPVVLNAGEAMSALVKAATTAEVQRRKAEIKGFLDGSDEMMDGEVEN